MSSGGGGDNLQSFLSRMEAELRRIGCPPMTDDVAFLAFQKAQFDRLTELEERFRELLVAHRWGWHAYQAFVKKVQEVSILSARPFFRVRQKMFSARISPALAATRVEPLQKFRVNYRFMKWVLSRYSLNKEFHAIFRQVIQLRKDIVMLVMPLALSRVRIFWARTPKSHLEYEDHLGTAMEGAMAAVDKFCPPFKKVFRGVIIGRIQSFLIESYSATSVHFFPDDRRLLYRANKLAWKVSGSGLDELDYEDLAREIEKMDDAPRRMGGNKPRRRMRVVAPDALASMMAAASCVSVDTGPSGIGRAVRGMVAPGEGPEEDCARTEAIRVVREEVPWCAETVVERKLLRMRGMLPEG